MMYDLCVVGAGMFGSAAARHASVNPALKVVLIGPDEPKNDDEKRHREIFGAHYDEGRITRVFDDQIACQNLGDQSIKRYRETETLSGINFYYPVGLLAYGQKGVKEIEVVRQNNALGKVVTQELDANLVKNRYPFLHMGEDNLAYLDENGAGHISPRRLAAAQQKIARLQGCEIVRDVVKEVTPLKENHGCFYHEVILEKGHNVRAKRVLICAGAFVHLKNLIPNDEGKVIDLKMVPDCAAMLRIPEEEAMRLRPMPSIIYYGSTKSDILALRAYALPPIKYPDGHYYIKIGSLDGHPELKTAEEVRKWYLSEGNPKIIQTRSQLMMTLLPGLKVEEVKGIACLLSYTPSGLPYIDRVSPTVSLAIGGNGKGAKFSDEIGRLAAELSMYGRWDSDLPRSLFKVQWKN